MKPAKIHGSDWPPVLANEIPQLPPELPELFIPIEQRLTLLQLNEHTCKWPIGDPLTPDFYFCGQHKETTSPYCEFHHRRAYSPVPPRKFKTGDMSLSPMSRINAY